MRDTNHLSDQAPRKSVALITDGSWVARTGLLSGITPEAQVGGGLALVRDGDMITIDAEKNALNVHLSRTNWRNVALQWQAPAIKVHQGCALQIYEDRFVCIRRLRYGCVIQRGVDKAGEVSESVSH